MAINLLTASDGRVDFGDLAGVAGQTALSLALIITPTVAPTNRRVVSQWGAASADEVFLWAVTDTDELGVVVSNDSFSFFGRKTTDLDLASGTTYRVVVTIAFGTPPTIHIYVNGVDKTLVEWLGSNDVPQSLNGTTAVQVGHETDEAAPGLEADYAEFAIWQRVLTAAQARTFTLDNQYPTCCGPTGLIYLPMLTTTDLTDRWSSVTATLTDGSDATHPAMFPCTRLLLVRP